VRPSLRRTSSSSISKYLLIKKSNFAYAAKLLYINVMAGSINTYFAIAGIN